MTHIHQTTLTDPIAVAGIHIRTINTEELAGTGKIGPLWQRFFAENLAARIPNRISDDLYVVYSNYDSDENGAADPTDAQVEIHLGLQPQA